MLILVWGVLTPNAHVKGHPEPTHLKSSPLFTFSTKLLGHEWDSPSFHLYNNRVKIHRRENKVGWRFTKLIFFLGHDSLSTKENNKNSKTLVCSRSTVLQILLGEDSLNPKFIHLEIQRWDGIESLTTLEEGEFKVPIDGCIRITAKHG